MAANPQTIEITGFQPVSKSVGNAKTSKRYPIVMPVNALIIL